jgi:para-aminobenzoate synthetase
MGIRTLIIDNYDSFTFNLFQMIAAINGEEPIVVRNNQEKWDTLAGLEFDNIVISPGPGTPEREGDFGVCASALLHARVPILGVCLGHQGLCYVFGGKVHHAPEPMHGRLSGVYHNGAPLFDGVPQGFQAVRYHSLIVEEPLPDCLEAIAWTSDRILMAIRHRTRPLWGVQFHPESICTEHGDRILRNFRDLSHCSERRHSGTPAASISVVPAPHQNDVKPAGYQVRTRKLDLFPEPGDVYRRLFQREEPAFWLDSSSTEGNLARFSFMGAGSGPHAALVSYSVAAGEVTERRGDHVRRFRESIYVYLERELRRRACATDDLPFDFNCGYVGYFGYELKAEVGATHRHECEYPDAMFLLADRVIAFDHQEKQTYLLCLVDPSAAEHSVFGEVRPQEAAANAWFYEMERHLREEDNARTPTMLSKRPIAFRLSRPHRTYLEDIERCKCLIRDGETYEVCLTNQLHTTAVPDPLGLYLTLRRINPSPYSAFLRFGEISVMCSSPERFLRIDRNGWVESKPIKGTRPRGRTPDEDAWLAEDLRSNEKDRSENLMITDLVRNDLGIVCEVGSLHVPRLMHVETYRTVHQLVSTIRGRLRSGLSPLECVRRTFPGGSMTGAPKLRTMNILDELETEPRGVYSGSIGFLAFNGTADLNIVIRTIVETPRSTTIGVGGAIVILSDAEAEFEEMILKAKALVHAVVHASRGGVDRKAYEGALDRLRENGTATF